MGHSKLYHNFPEKTNKQNTFSSIHYNKILSNWEEMLSNVDVCKIFNHILLNENMQSLFQHEIC